MSAGTPTAGAPEPLRLLSGAQVRRLTARAMRAHGGGKLSEAAGSAYTLVFTLAVALSMVVGLVQTTSTTVRGTADGVAVPISWVAAPLLLAAVGAAMGLCARLGPFGLGGGQAAWWLPMPVERAGLLRPRFVSTMVLTALSGAFVGLVMALFVDGVVVGLGIAGGAACGAAIVVLTGVAQLVGRATRSPAVLIGDSLLASAPVAMLAIGWLRPDPLVSPSAPIGWSVTAAAGLVAFVGGVVVARASGRIDGAELRARGATGQYLSASVSSLDTRELSRALSAATQRSTRRRSRSMGVVRGPASAVVIGDALLWLRTPRHVLQVVVTALGPVAFAVAQWATPAVAVGVVVFGYSAALASTEGARRAEMAPALDRIYPIDAATARRSRLVFPASVVACWVASVLGFWAGTHGEPVLVWVALGLAAGPALAAGALRGAYRPPPDWSSPLVPNPYGPSIPPALVATFTRGPDIAILFVVPLVLAMLGVSNPVTLLWWQLGASAIAAAISTHVAKEQEKT